MVGVELPTQKPCIRLSCVSHDDKDHSTGLRTWWSLSEAVSGVPDSCLLDTKHTSIVHVKPDSWPITCRQAEYYDNGKTPPNHHSKTLLLLMMKMFILDSMTKSWVRLEKHEHCL